MMNKDLNDLRYTMLEYLEGKGVPMQGRNRKFDPPEDKIWARFSTVGGEGSFGELGHKWIRQRGVVVIQLFAPLNTGTADIDALAEDIKETFSGSTYGYLELAAGSWNEVPTTTDFYHINVNLPYRHK